MEVIAMTLQDSCNQSRLIRDAWIFKSHLREPIKRGWWTCSVSLKAKGLMLVPALILENFSPPTKEGL